VRIRFWSLWPARALAQGSLSELVQGFALYRFFALSVSLLADVGVRSLQFDGRSLVEPLADRPCGHTGYQPHASELPALRDGLPGSSGRLRGEYCGYSATAKRFRRGASHLRPRGKPELPHRDGQGISHCANWPRKLSRRRAIHPLPCQGPLPINRETVKPHEPHFRKRLPMQALGRLEELRGMRGDAPRASRGPVVQELADTKRRSLMRRTTDLAL